jgi:hypothetical protein
MKTYLTKPGFEVIFSLGLIVIMVLPLLVFAQEAKKNIDIRIMNGDTTVNGKAMKDLSPEDRKQALKDINNLGNADAVGNGRRQHIVFRKRSLTDSGARKIIIEQRNVYRGNKDDELTNMPGLKGDSSRRVLRFRMKNPNGSDSTFVFNYRLNTDPADRFEPRDRDWDYRMRNRWMENYHHRNVQRFDYMNTGSDGISTHTSFRVSDASPEKLKDMTKTEKADLELKDLNLVPQFSSAKTLLMFSLASKAAADVKLTDNEGKLIWTEKALNGSFSKSFPLGLNGVYYLEVKQAGKAAFKRIVKEE